MHFRLALAAIITVRSYQFPVFLGQGGRRYQTLPIPAIYAD